MAISIGPVTGMPIDGSTIINVTIPLTATALITDTIPPGFAYLEMQVATDAAFTNIIADIRSQDALAAGGVSESVTLYLNGATRDPALWPFAAPGQSVWNTAIGTSATYSAGTGSDARVTDWASDTGGTNSASFPVFFAEATDTPVTITVSGTPYTFLIPAAAAPSTDAVEGMVVIAPGHDVVWETVGTVVGGGTGLIPGNLLDVNTQDAETNVGTWNSNGNVNAPIRDNTHAFNGSWSVLWVATAAGAFMQTGLETISASNPVTFFVNVWAPVGRNLTANVQFWNSGSFLNQVIGTTVFGTGGWVLLSITVPSGGGAGQVPVTANQALGYVYVNDSVNGEDYWTDYTYMGVSPTPPAGGGWTATSIAQVSPSGTGILGTGTGFVGVRGCGASAVGGMIRSWEQQAGVIGHALAIGLSHSQLNTTFVYPATQSDPAQAGATGHNPIGELLAIPQSVNLAGLGLTANGLIVATALQKYGGYVVEQEVGFRLYAEPGIDATFLSNINSDMHLITAQLRVVTNAVANINTLLSLGCQGGGTPLAAVPPRLSLVSINPPTNLTVPTISGTPAVGTTLTSTTGTWTNNPTSYTYQWYRSVATAIAGATSSTYIPVSGDVGHTLMVTVTATNVNGSAHASSLQTAVVTISSTGTFTRPFSADSLWYRPIAGNTPAVSTWANPGITAPSGGFDGEVEVIIDGTAPGAVVTTALTGNNDGYNGAPRATGGSNYVDAHGESVYLPANLIVPDVNGGASDPVPSQYLTPSGSTPNNDGAFLTNDGVWWISPQIIARPHAGGPIWFSYNMEDIAMTSRGTYGGRNASQLSAVGGSVRPGEMEGTPPAAGATGPNGTCSINHAIKLVVPMELYGRQDTGFGGGPGFTTPARTRDSYYTTGYRGSSFWMGSLLAIRPADYAAARAAMTTNQGRNIVDTLCVYGGYVCEDSAWDHWGICTDINAYQSGVMSGGAVSADFSNAVTRLWVVLNNNPPT